MIRWLHQEKDEMRSGFADSVAFASRRALEHLMRHTLSTRERATACDRLLVRHTSSKNQRPLPGCMNYHIDLLWEKGAINMEIDVPPYVYMLMHLQ
jgi:hypothetical protein